MKVSILVPVYGVENYIERCAVSLMEQTYCDIEYVFVDDCSKDGSIGVLRSVVSRYPDREGSVTVLRHERNRGLAAARQTALEAATGDYVMIVDSDDYIATNAVEVLVEAVSHNDADIADAGFAAFDNDGVIETTSAFMGAQNKYLKLILCHNIVTNRVWGRLYRRNLFFERKIFFTEGINYGEDYSVTARLMLDANRVVVEDICYYYRTDNSASYSNNISSVNAASFLQANRLVQYYFAENDPSHSYATALSFGFVDVLRFCRRFGVNIADVDNVCPYKVKGIVMKALSSMMRNNNLPYPLVNFLYLAARRIYATFVRI